MHQFNTGLKGAMEWVSNYHDDVEAKFLDGLKRLPPFGSKVDEELEEYVLGMANWPRGHDCWSFESGRYFGNKGLEIQESRCVPLLPMVSKKPNLKREKVVVSLVEL
jgi:Delta6-protoilludene synthase